MRDATDPGQPVGATFIAILGGASVAVDKQHKIKFHWLPYSILHRKLVSDGLSA